jgi:hypothetical protein
MMSRNQRGEERMSNKQQTAVEWQHIELSKFLNGKSEFTDAHDILIKAKEMEKERIETAYNKGTVHGIDYPESTLPITGEQYYEQTYGGGEQ